MFRAATILLVATFASAQNRPPERAEIVAFVSNTYVHGVPEAEARALGRDAVPTLLELLKRPPTDDALPNVVQTLGYIGDARARQPLIEFLETSKGEVNDATFDALLAVPLAIGHLASNGDQGSLIYLLSWTAPNALTSSNLQWTAGAYTGKKLSLLIAKLAVNGLGVTGLDEAHEQLVALRAMASASVLRENIDEAIEHNRDVKRRKR